MASFSIQPATSEKPRVVTYSFPGATNPRMEISYFDFGGKAEAIRLLAYHGEVNFSDHRFERHQFRAAKESGKLPFGQMPMLTVSATTHISQCNSILRTVARYSRKSYLYPTEDVLKCGTIDAILDLDADVFTPIVVRNYKERFGFDFLNDASSEPFIDSVTKNLKERVLPNHLSNLSLLVGTSNWLGGDWANPTIADFNFGVRLEYLNNLQEFKGIVTDGYPKLKDFLEQFKKLGSNVQYYKN